MADQTTKQDVGKPDLTLLLNHIPNALLAMVAVRAYGNKKYSAIAEAAGVAFDSESWRRNASSRYIASIARHLLAVCQGERENAEDGGVNHLAQIAIDACFALEIEHTEKQASTASETQSWDEQASASVGASQKPFRDFVWLEDGSRQPLIIKSPADLPTLEQMVTMMSRKKRWGGHHVNAPTLLEHCALVANIANETYYQQLRDIRNSAWRRLMRSCLLHDAAEVLFGDVPTPVKHLERKMLRELKACGPLKPKHPNDILTARFNAALSQRYDLDLADPRIKRADTLAAVLEARWLGISDSELTAWFTTEELAASKAMNPARYNKDWLHLWERCS